MQEITFDGFRASGIRCLINGEEQLFESVREVILCAGALSSPQLLMLSGIGPEDELRKHKIRVRLHKPGVGQNLRDHIDYVFAYRSPSHDLFGISFPGLQRLLKEFRQYRRDQTGMLSSNFAEAGAFLKSDPNLACPDIQLHFVVGLLDDHGRKLHKGHGFSCHVCLLKPKSVGKLTLNSADPTGAPQIDPAFLTHPDDISLLKAAYKQVKNILDADQLAPFREEELYPVDTENEQQLEWILRQRSDTIYHPVGTCRMGSDAMAVVDSELKVSGFQGLRVVDASVMPTLIRGNTNAPCMMIAEKAADMILEANPVKESEWETSEPAFAEI